MFEKLTTLFSKKNILWNSSPNFPIFPIFPLSAPVHSSVSHFSFSYFSLYFLIFPHFSLFFLIFPYFSPYFPIFPHFSHFSIARTLSTVSTALSTCRARAHLPRQPPPNYVFGLDTSFGGGWRGRCAWGRGSIHRHRLPAVPG